MPNEGLKNLYTSWGNRILPRPQIFMNPAYRDELYGTPDKSPAKKNPQWVPLPRMCSAVPKRRRIVF